MQEQVEMLSPEMKDAMNLLAKAWADTKPAAVRNEFGFITGYIHGSKSLSKMLVFKQNNLLTNAIIQHFYGLPPSRMEGEEYKEYKLRLKFQQALIKHRARIYNYTEADEEKRKRKADKIMKKVFKVKAVELDNGQKVYDLNKTEQ